MKLAPQRRLLMRGACRARCAGACVGPNFKRPAPPKVERYTGGALPTETASAPGPAVPRNGSSAEAEVPRNWWTLFGSARTRRTGHARRCAPIRRCNPRKRRCARHWRTPRAARQLFSDGARRASTQPAIATPPACWQPNLASGTALYNLYTPQVTVSYRSRHLRRQPPPSGIVWRRRPKPQRFQLDATYLTLTANVVTAAIQEAGLRAQIEATNR
jgi:hypothetical protein